MELTKEYFDQIVQGLATKKDLENFATKDDLGTLPSREEFKALQTSVDEIRETVDRIDKRDVEDSDAHAKNYVNHEHRITRIEKQLKLKPAV